jgi:phage terminase large subunit-like protein
MTDVALDDIVLQRWRSDPITFIEEVLHDPETRKPYRLLPAERAFLGHAFQTDAGGRLKYPEQVYACPKKSGKTAFAAMHTLTTTLLFGGSYPEATLCANDFDQAQGRVFEAVKRIVECSPLLRSEAKITADVVSFPAIDAVIKAIASDYAGAAGGNQVVSVFDELWGYVSERSRRLWDEMVPPPTRRIALRLTTTYAGFEGESALLEELHKRGMALPEVAPSLHAGDGLLVFWSHDPVAPWQDERWLADMRRLLRPNAYLRMIENRFVTTESSFIDLAWWDACVDPAVTPLVTQHSLPVTVGIDASVKRDSTAIVAVTWDRQRQKVVLVWHRIYQPTPDDPLDFEAAIESTVLDLHSRFRLTQVLFDPYQMAASAQRLTRAGVKMVEYPQSSPNLTASSQGLYELIKGRNIVAYPDPQLRLALSRAVAVEGSRGWKISKEKQTHKIDVVVALAMAALAAIQTQSKYRYDTSLNWVSGP